MAGLANTTPHSLPLLTPAIALFPLTQLSCIIKNMIDSPSDCRSCEVSLRQPVETMMEEKL